MQYMLLLLVAACALVSGIPAVAAQSCPAGHCDTLANGDFGLGRIFFDRNHRIIKDYDATIEVIPGTPQHVLDNIGAAVDVKKNLLLMAADAKTSGKFFTKGISVAKSSTIQFLFSALIPVAGINGYCRVVGPKDLEYHKVLFSSLKTRQWVDYSYDIPPSAAHRVLRVECYINGDSSSDHSILFKYLRLCVSFPPSKGIKNKTVSNNLLHYNNLANSSKLWQTTPGVSFMPGPNGDHKVVFSKTDSDEKLTSIFFTYANRVYSLSGTVDADLSYMPFKIYINGKVVKPLFRAASAGISAVGTQFHVQISNPGTNCNVTIVREKSERYERTIRPIAFYIHGCVVPKPKVRRSAPYESLHDEL